MFFWREQHRKRRRRQLCAQLLARLWSAGRLALPPPPEVPHAAPSRSSPARPRLCFIHPRGLCLEVELKRLITLIGSGADCDIRFVNAGLDRRHFAFLALPDGLFGIDLHRAQADPAATAGGWWTSQSSARLQRIRLRAKLPDFMPLAAADIPSPLELLLTWSTHGQRQNFPLASRITLLGAGKWCGLRLADPALAPVQAALVRTPHALTLVHLADNSWTRCRGRPIAAIQLDPGDEFELGRTTFQLASHWHEPVARTVPELPVAQDWRETLTHWTKTVATSDAERCALAGVLAQLAHHLHDQAAPAEQQPRQNSDAEQFL